MDSGRRERDGRTGEGVGAGFFAVVAVAGCVDLVAGLDGVLGLLRWSEVSGGWGTRRGGEAGREAGRRGTVTTDLVEVECVLCLVDESSHGGHGEVWAESEEGWKGKRRGRELAES